MQRRVFATLFLACLFFVLPDATLTQTGGGDQKMPSPLGRLVDVGGYRVHLYCTGTGSPTVVIVGAGYSFDWGLIQPEMAAISRICTYDHSGSAWSDTGPKDSCQLRVNEVHAALKNAGIEGPYVLVGHSLGGLISRLYAGQYPNEVAGVVFVDDALAMVSRRPAPAASAAARPPPMPPPMPPPPPSPPLAKAPQGMEDDPNFSKLPARDRELHLWWAAHTRDHAPGLDDLDMLMDCTAQADAIVKDQSHPLGDKPLVDITAGNPPPMPPAMVEKWAPNYAELQTKLLSLSGNGKHLVAQNSGHFVIIDRPDVVIDAISQVVWSVRHNTKF